MAMAQNFDSLLSKYDFKVLSKTDENMFCLLCKKLMSDAYQTHCECQYCEKCLTAFLSYGNKPCNGNKNKCQNEDLVINQNVTKNPILIKKILNLRVCCPNESCSYEDKISQIEGHLRICSEKAIECPYVIIGCCNEKANEEKIVYHLESEIFLHSQFLADFIQNWRNEVDTLKKYFELEITSLKKEISSIKKKNNQNDRNDINVRSIFNDKFEYTSVIGEVLFTLVSLRSRISNNDTIYTPPFFSHDNGYKVQVVVKPAGLSTGKGTHLTVGVRICSGEHDDNLPWPCMHAFNICIVNQYTQNTENDRLFGITNKGCSQPHLYNKPYKNQDNQISYYNKYIWQKWLWNTKGLVVDESVIFKISAIAPSN